MTKKYLAILLLLCSSLPALAIERNVASQKVYVTAIDSATGRPKTGDAANITAYVAKDGGTVTVLGDTSATEYDSTNAKGVYWFDITQTETNAICDVVTGKSSTSGIDIIPQVLYTTPAGFSAGTANVNTQTINSVSTSSVTTINANLGTTQPINFTGTGASAYAKSDVISVAGDATTATNLNFLYDTYWSLWFDASNKRVKADVTAWGTSTTPVTNLGTVFNTDFATNYDATNHFWNHNSLQLIPTTPTANTYGEAAYLTDIARGRRNTAQTGTSTTITLDASASSTDGTYVGDCIYLPGGTGGGLPGTGQRRTVIAYNGTTKVATVDRAWSTTPDNTTTFITLPEPLANVGLWSNSPILPTPGRSLYVATTGSDSNPGTAALPKLSINGALAIAGKGDTIYVGTGTFGGFTSTVQYVTINGNGVDPSTHVPNTIVTVASGTAAILASHDTLSCMTVSCTDVDPSSTGVGVDASNTTGATITGVIAIAPYDALQGLYSVDLHTSGDSFLGQYDGGNLTGAKGYEDYFSTYETDGTYADTSGNGYAGLNVGVDTRALMYGTRFRARKGVTTADQVAGLRIAGHGGSDSANTYDKLVLIGPEIFASNNASNSTGPIVGIGAPRLASSSAIHVFVFGGRITTTKSANVNATSTVYDVDATLGNGTTLGSRVVIRGTACDPTKLNGLGTTIDYDYAQSGDVKVDTAAIKTKTDFLPSVIAGGSGGLFIAGTNAPTTVNITGSLSGTVGGLSGVTFPTNFADLSISAATGRVDIGKILGTASAGAAGYMGPDWGHVNAPTTTVALSGTTVKNATDINTKLGTPAGASIAEDISNIESGGSSGTPSDIATEPVNTNRVFVLVPGTSGLRSESTKTITAGSPPNTYAVDFRNDAASNQKIYTVDSVAIVTGTSGGVTFGTAERDGGTQARVRITGVTAGNYVVRVSITYVGGASSRGDITIKVVD